MKGSSVEKVVWKAWKAMELPEGYRAEIVEGVIEVSSNGGFAHAQVANRLWDALADFLRDSEYGAWSVTDVIHRRTAWTPDVLVAPRDGKPGAAKGGLGLKASAVRMVVEVVSPGKRDQERDRFGKRRDYARAGIPVYVLVDDYDGQGAVTLFTMPQPDRADWEDIHRVPYGTDVTIPEGPAKGFVIGEAITGPKRGS
ncbi:Uma2 family endonuclease [Streptomyces sp. NBC_01235]|uniref:Uma2 family endonuclease n=1 Tax=Streptomyces sp. NBC_01235 TaxID=2903788 RepID=UPI002E0D9EB7|nr:Uma2 family endonuclease [Streptomyces sp. NBC_01235]